MKLVGLLAAVLPLPALALSCMPWDVDSAYTAADESRDAYLVVSGVLRFDAAALPVTDWSKQMATPPSTAIPARLTGMSMAENGFENPFDHPVTLVIGCAGPWCASAQPGPTLAFVKRAPEGWVLEQGACGGFYFGDPGPEALRRVLARFAGMRPAR